MFYSQSLICNDDEKENLKEIKDYITRIPTNERDLITIPKIKEHTRIETEKIGKIIDILVENKLLIPHFAIRCENCGMIIDDIYNVNNIDLSEDYYCYNCDEIKKIDSNDIICMFSINSLYDFFDSGQLKEISIETDSSADDDIIHFKDDIILKDINGNIIEINTPKPEYLIDSIL